ncbi:hypothetical protein BpHYR1_052495 [Brachionus plicatilis]|uniref:Uncharacterized protein n=1 Tax=Brachionus plicatilis TaxID=10195 RepID=A0A3M7R876_BRAPC|nr:hypothetical protein BpHYR1_052495 [Brachionus plicatilis]
MVVLGGGQLWPAGLRPDLNGHLAGQFKRPILAVLKVEFIIYQNFGSVLIKIFFWTVLWPAGPHTVGRLTVFQLAGHHTVGPSVGRPLHGRFLFWPIVGRPPHGFLKFGRPLHGRSVSWPRLGRPGTVIGR